ncbi:MAG: hypothetical protein ABI637_10020 [Gemmatimonadota bacterium]
MTDDPRELFDRRMQPSVIRVAAALVLLSACTGAFEVTPAALEGTWGGPHAEVTFDATGRGMAQYECASGTLDPPPWPTSSGRFTATGEHVIGHGGPVGDGDAHDAHPAQYEGRLHGDRLSLTVRLLDQDIVLGPFELQHGQPGALFRCL